MTDAPELIVPPHSAHAEQAVLGSMLADNRCIDDVVDLVTESDFYLLQSRETFGAILNMAAAGQPTDAVTVSDRFPDIDLGFLAGLVRNLPSTANVRAYAQTVKDYAIKRALICAARDIQTLAFDHGPVGEALDKSQALVMAVSQESPNGTTARHVRDILPEVVNRVDERCQRGSTVVGLRTGFDSLDNQTAGLHPGDMIILAGRPSMGKTTLAMNIARNAALRGDAVGVFSLEMSADQLVEREVAATAKVDYQRFRVGQLRDDEWPRVTKGAAHLTNAPLFIDDTAALAIHELRSRARRLKRAHDVKLLVIDYLQLMRADGENQTQRIGAISAGIKALAKELHIPIIALSQLNRSLEMRTNKRPTMSDLRDSGNLEQDADVILFLYRDEIYHEDTSWKGIAEVIVGKQRNGPTGMVPLTFLGHRMAFESFAGELPARTSESGHPPSRPRGFTYAAKAGTNDE